MVQLYIPVMARPLVLHRKHKAIWTSVYADIEVHKLYRLSNRFFETVRNF